ncbi:hypothetical protein [Enhygromyxa salina]|uniref:hypothetical protein n=1 Tax=Enhygromyxa salina TaxID=215803 RepID=UPI000D0274BC|nr:hypothetical protein [Enhygromyxa salina]
MPFAPWINWRPEEGRFDAHLWDEDAGARTVLTDVTTGVLEVLLDGLQAGSPDVDALGRRVAFSSVDDPQTVCWGRVD